MEILDPKVKVVKTMMIKVTAKSVIGKIGETAGFYRKSIGESFKFTSY